MEQRQPYTTNYVNLRNPLHLLSFCDKPTLQDFHQYYMNKLT